MSWSSNEDVVLVYCDEERTEYKMLCPSALGSMRLWIRVAKIRFPRSGSGFSHKYRVRSLVILGFIEMSHLKWSGH